MGHLLELAVSGRAGCRGCGAKIAKGAPRFGERLPNPFADEGELTLWFHPACAAFKRPEPFLEALDEHALPFDGREVLAAEARRGVELRRLPRLDGAERAPSARALCRDCRETIDKDLWRLRLVYFEDGRFVPGGFVHATCAESYFGTGELLERALRFTPALADDAGGRAELAALLGE